MTDYFCIKANKFPADLEQHAGIARTPEPLTDLEVAENVIRLQSRRFSKTPFAVIEISYSIFAGAFGGPAASIRTIAVGGVLFRREGYEASEDDGE